MHNFPPAQIIFSSPQMKITPTQMIFSPVLVDKKIATTDNISAKTYANIANTDYIFANAVKNAASYYK